MLESEKLARHALSELNLPQTKDHKTILEAFMKTGLPIKEELIASLMRTYGSLASRDKVAARVLALLADKGLLPAPEDAEKLVRAVTDPLSEKRRDQGKKREHGGQDRGTRHRQRKNARSIRSADIRTAAERTWDSGGLLSLFNHVRGGHDHWVVIPFSLEGREETLVLRCCMGRDDRIRRYTLSVYGEHSWHFEGRRSGKSHRIVVYCSDKKIRGDSHDVIERLRKKLGNLSLEIDDTIREVSGFDPFVSDHITDSHGVDTRV